ncbi:unnamed protein product [Linum trigynum]|uniref:Uncharacterized protein n=1 Tax=Linum trigynum TaxID=586398 RepID=A0AAV2EAY3_9ROSI
MMDFPPLIKDYLLDEDSTSSNPTDEPAAAVGVGFAALPASSPTDAREMFLDEFQASAEANLAKHIDAMAAMPWIGKMVTKHNMKGAEPLLGGVLNYITDEKLFQVVYRDGSTETLGIDKLRDRRSLALLLGDDEDDINFDPNLWGKGGDQQEAGDDVAAAAAMNNVVHHQVLQNAAGGITARASTSAGDRGKGTVAAAKPKTKSHTATPRPKKPRTLQQDPSSYVPLAYRETKADDYYWYGR